MAIEKERFSTAIAAHRGGALLWPENSPMAFRGAIDLGVDQIETDIHLSADDEPVVIHDPTLDRTTLGSGVVHDYDWQTLQSIELKNTGGECVPHLNDLLALLKPTGIVLRLELKADYNRLEYNSLVEIATDALRSAQMLERTIFTSFTWSYLSTIRSIVPNAPLIGLINAPRLAELGGVNGAIQLAKEQDVPEIAFPVDLLEEGDVERARAADIRLGVYAVKSEAQTRRALTRGVSAFTTDLPDIALKLRAEL